MLSAVGQDKITQKAITLGAEYYVVKPFDIELLIKRIRELKNYKPNLLVRFFKTGFIKKCISMTLAFVVAGRFGDVDMEAVILFVGIGMLLLWLGSLYPLANIKSYCKKHHIDEAIRKDTGYMNIAINAFNVLPTKKMLSYIKTLNPAAAQEIERQLAAKKK